jgi:rhamnopyranosyl-N-acetylglucosaminyl-diphospho-decaprenol beta-1,3/1,4-galactofuranosyltransferase
VNSRLSDIQNQVAKFSGCSEADVAVIVVTYNRSGYLHKLLLSIADMTCRPRWVIVIDNASTDDTQSIISDAVRLFPSGVLRNSRQTTNLGGTGGFAAGMAEAIRLGSTWLWLLDDDLEVIPDGLEKLLRWGARFKCIQGARLDFDGSPFFFQPFFSEWLGVVLPFIRNPFSGQSYRPINVGCFEGMFIHLDVVGMVGLPDARFFMTWDDAMYGWLISQVTILVLVDDFVLRRTRAQRKISLGLRHLNDASDTFRFYMMRNRGFVAEYLAKKQKLSRFGFALGTFLVFSKEIVRLLFVEHQLHGISALYRGWREALRIRRTASENF